MSTIPSWAVKGAKVVCIKRGAWSNRLLPGETDPFYGQVLTVREVVYCNDGCLLRFCEILNPTVRLAPSGAFEEAGYAVEQFRPVTKRTAEQDIAEHFSHHLRQPVRETERAE